MNNQIYDELDRAIDQLIANPESTPKSGNPEVANVLQLACALRQLPSPDFKSRLKTELDWVAAARPLSTRQPQPANAPSVLPSLFGNPYGAYPMRHINFVASLALHATAMLLVAVLGVLAFKGKPSELSPDVRTVITLSNYIPSPGINQHQGGGSGSGADKIKQSKGNLPRTADYQFVPPTVIKPQPSRFMVDSTIIAPDLHVAQNDHIGDPLSNLMTPSDGTGVKGGIGTNGSGGVGSGRGPGFGPGEGGNFGTGVFTLGNGVTAPRPIYDPEPEYSPEARAAHYQGTVLVWAIVDQDGIPRNPRVKRSLGMGLDEKALAAIRTWRFQPGTKDGHAVAVAIEVEVNFRLY